ncbi:hypothetical protein PoB_003754100 [Plakobranchus ocellatus]|uniref:Uncharacterized protein n=1 Tax=Plakobranchus ocellatus TaxID=259542 RepID=A0AAV4AIP1_9GAST|nr:hypothetical protein PoB_003754100 [Plakobranchus ocellatus]
MVSRFEKSTMNDHHLSRMRNAWHFSNLGRYLMAWRAQGKPSTQQGDLGLSGPTSSHGAGGGARTRDRRVPADLSADSLATMPLTPQQDW